MDIASVRVQVPPRVLNTFLGRALTQSGPRVLDVYTGATLTLQELKYLKRSSCRSFFFVNWRMHFTYILFSSKLSRYYIGYSENPEKRLEEKHNRGLVKSTKPGIPYILAEKNLFLLS